MRSRALVGGRERREQLATRRSTGGEETRRSTGTEVIVGRGRAIAARVLAERFVGALVLAGGREVEVVGIGNDREFLVVNVRTGIVSVDRVTAPLTGLG